MRRDIISALALIGAMTNLIPVQADDAKKEPTGPTLTAAMRTETIDSALKRLNDRYVFPEVAKKMEDSIRKRLQNKEYDSISDGKVFAETLTRHFQEISKDKHLRVHFSAEPIPERSQNAPSPLDEERMRAEQQAFG